MAIIEIARIQIRRGQQSITGEPTLAAGEFGWAQDTETLWIGKSVSEGAPNSNNTRVLTENDLNLFSVSITTSTYQYAGHIPLITISSTVERSLQSKLDDAVSVLDFGADNSFGSTSSHNVSTIQLAIDELFLSPAATTDEAPAGRVVLKLPPGTFNLNANLLLPPYATIMGAGKGRTILNLTTASSSLIKFSDADGAALSPATLSGKLPKNISVIGMTLQYDPSIVTTAALPLMVADSAEDCYLGDVEFKGAYDFDAPQASNSDYCGLEIAGQTYSFNTRGLVVDNCAFTNLFCGVKSDNDCEDVFIHNSKFDELNRGISYSEVASTSTSITGPLRTKVYGSKFTNVLREAFYVGDAYGADIETHHVSTLNSYKNVGGADDNPITPVINFLTLANVSAEDYMSRYAAVNNTSTVSALTGNWAVTGKAFLDRQTVYSTNITASTATVTLIKLPFNGSEQSNRIDYNILKPASNISRQGSLLVHGARLGGSPSVTITENYTFTGANDGQLEFVAELNTASNTINLGYTSVDAIGTITYKYSQLQ